MTNSISSEDPPNKKAEKNIAAMYKASLDAEKQRELEDSYRAGQLMLWPPERRGVPNAFARCAIFGVANKKTKRQVFLANSPKINDILGGGHIAFWGEEVRQDDLTVWLQLIQLFKEAKSEWVSFTPYSFLKSIRWSPTTHAYKRLLSIIRRLAGANVEVFSKLHGRGINTRLLQNYDFSTDEKSEWRIRLYDKKDQLLFLFEQNLSHLEWNQRSELPEGVATWLHAYYSTHKTPYALKILTLALGAGLKVIDPLDDALPEPKRIAIQKTRLRECKRLIKNALEELVRVGFLKSFNISKTGLVTVFVA